MLAGIQYYTSFTCTCVNNVVLLSVIDMIVQPFDTAQLGTILSIMHSMPATHYLGTALSTVTKYPNSPAYHVHGWCLVIITRMVNFIGHVTACKWKEHLWYRHVDMYLYVMHEKITAQLL